MLKRAWLSVIRKPSRSIILIVILFVMANMMLATLSIKASVESSVEYAKESLSGIVYLEPDMETIREEAMANMETGGGRTSIRMERPEIPVSMVESIADSEYVKDYTYSVTGRADANDLEPVETEEQQMRNQINSSGAMGGGPFGSSDGESFNIMGATGDMTITGINSFAFISEVEAGNMKLLEGEIFDETTDGSVMISSELADLNDLNIGDEITLDTVNPADSEDVESVTLSIIGIYYVTTENFNGNTIYMNPQTATQFATMMDDDDTDTEDFAVESVKYYLVNAEDKDAFLAEANSKYPDLADDNIKLSIDDTAYQQMVGPIESVGSFATTILWVVMVAAVAIITLIVTINVKDRRYEMGVLLSLGATKQNIFGQILLELVVVGTLGFVLSIGTSTFLARSMGSSLLENQVSMSEQQSEQNFGRGQNAMPSGGGTFNRMDGPGGPTSISSAGAVSDVEPISEIDVTPTLSNYAVLFAAGYLIIILSLAIPSVNIMRYQPKTILTGKE